MVGRLRSQNLPIAAMPALPGFANALTVGVLPESVGQNSHVATVAAASTPADAHAVVEFR